MAYNGYRIKINGTVFPNKYISQGSYKAVSKKRVVETWKDANQVEHEVTTGTTKANISFSIREHDSTEHSTLVAFFQNDNNNTVEYYDDRTDSYKTATCRLKDITFAHMNTYGGKLQYKSTAINLIEN